MPRPSGGPWQTPSRGPEMHPYSIPSPDPLTVLSTSPCSMCCGACVAATRSWLVDCELSASADPEKGKARQGYDPRLTLFPSGHPYCRRETRMIVIELLSTTSRLYPASLEKTTTSRCRCSTTRCPASMAGCRSIPPPPIRQTLAATGVIRPIGRITPALDRRNVARRPRWRTAERRP